PSAQSTVSSTPINSEDPVVAGHGLTHWDAVASLAPADTSEAKADLVDVGAVNGVEIHEWQLAASSQAGGGIDLPGTSDEWAFDDYSIKSTGIASFYDSITVGAGDSDLPDGTEVPLYLVVRDAGNNFGGLIFDTHFLAGARVYHSDGTIATVGL